MLEKDKERGFEIKEEEEEGVFDDDDDDDDDIEVEDVCEEEGEEEDERGEGGEGIFRKRVGAGPKTLSSHFVLTIRDVDVTASGVGLPGQKKITLSRAQATASKKFVRDITSCASLS